MLATDARDAVVREALDAYVNFTYRSLRYREVGAAGARLDAAESVPPLLTALFALEHRIRPFNKYVAAALPDGFPLARLLAVLDGDADEQHALFRDVERVARKAGFDDVLDAWEPDLAWLRGEGEYRSQRGAARGRTP